MINKRAVRWEMVIVLAMSLGQSAVYSILSIVEKMTRPQPLNQQVTRMNSSATPDRLWLDLAYQIVNTLFPLMPAVLVLFLLAVHARPQSGPFAAIGFDLRRKWADVWQGVAIFAVIGSAGLAFYLLARNLGWNTTVQPANLAAAWWVVPVLVGRAVMNGVVEEVVMIGYLFERWRQSAGRMWHIVVISAVVRGGYHLYQGWGGFVGNLVMGLIFGWLYLKIRRVMPLVIVHTLLDLFAFVGYALLADYLPWL